MDPTQNTNSPTQPVSATPPSQNPVSSQPITQSSIPSHPEVKEKKHGSSPLILILVAIVFLSLGFLGGWIYMKKTIPQDPKITVTSPTPTPTVAPMTIVTPVPAQKISGWKTYDNKTLHISFEYPSNWIVTDKPFGNTSDISFVGLLPATKTQGDTVTPIYIDHWSNPNQLSLKDWESAQDSLSAMPPNLYDPAKQQKISVVGFSAYENSKANCEPLLCDEIVAMVRGDIFVFHNVEIPDKYTAQELQDNATIFHQILTTLQFSK